MADVEFLDQLTIKIDRDEDNLINVRWLNEVGGISQFTFKKNYYYNNEQKDGKFIVNDRFSEKSNYKALSINYNRVITAGADNLDYDTWLNLSKIYFAQVQDGSEWVNCIIEHNAEEVSVREGTYKREIKILLNPYKFQSF